MKGRASEYRAGWIGWGGVAATLCFVLIAFLLGWPAIRGDAALGPEAMLDADPLYGGPKAALAPIHPPSDPTPIALDLPRDQAVARGLWQGRLDRWNPRAGFGTPLWAELGGPFFPLKLPFYLLPTRTAYAAFLLLRLAFAALGTYLLARRRGLGIASAIAAGITFELCDSVLSQVPFGVYSNTFVLPWVLFAAETLSQRPGSRVAAGAAVVLGVAMSAGHPGIGALTLAAFAAFMLGSATASWRNRRAALAQLGWATAAAGLGLAFAAPTLLPAAHMLSLGASYKDTVVGDTLRSTVLQGSRALMPGTLFLPEFAERSTLSLFALGPAAIGIFAGGLSASLFAVGAVGLLVGATPASLDWINHIPPVRLLHPIYAHPLIALPLAIAVGSGIERLATFPARQILLAAASPLLAWLVLTVLCNSAYGVHLSVLIMMMSTRRWMSVLGVTAAVLGLAVVLRRTRVAPQLALLVTAAIACERIVATGPRLRQPAAVVAASAPSEAVRLLQGSSGREPNRMIGVPYWVGYPLTTMLFGLSDARNFAAFPLRRYLDYLGAIDVPAGPAQFKNLAAATVVQKVQVNRSPLLDLAAVRWVVVPRSRIRPPAPLLEGDPSMPLALADRFVLVYENRAALPRVRIAHTVKPLANEDAARAWARGIGATKGHARDLDLADFVALEPDAAGTPPPRLRGHAAAGESVSIIDVSDPDRLLLAATLEKPAVIVIADTYDPGWRAWVDGTPAPLFPANLAFRAVHVPAGTHRIELRYVPRAFTLGIILFLAAGIICCACYVRRRDDRPVSRA